MPAGLVETMTESELQTTPMGRSLLAGKLVVTLRSQDGTHITLRFSCKSPGANGGRWQRSTFADARRIYVVPCQFQLDRLRMVITKGSPHHPFRRLGATGKCRQEGPGLC